MRLVTLPAFVVGIAFAILFFNLYGVMSRPEVPRPIAFVVGEFAPGVEIGAKVADIRQNVAGMTYVRYVGFVGVPRRSNMSKLPDLSVEFQQVRLLLDERTRDLPSPDVSAAHVDAVEVLTAQRSAAGELVTLFTTMFRKQPIVGCARGSDDGMLRDVQTWSTPNARGGLSVVSDYSGSPTYAGLTVTSVFAFAGKFDGGNTLRALYRDVPCSRWAAEEAEGQT
jgi:hypothetical protein